MSQTRAVPDVLRGEKNQIIVQLPAPPIVGVTLAGCGVRTPLYAAYAKQALNKEVEYIVGVSGGAVAGLLMALGCTYDEINDILNEVELTKFLEKSKPWRNTPAWLSKVWRSFAIFFKTGHALSSGRVFLEWLQHKIELKLGKKNATFADLAAKIASDKKINGKSLCKQFIVAASDITNEVPELKIFSAETTPDDELADAVRTSAAYPFLFELVKKGDKRLLDGGLLNNCPIHELDKRHYLPKGYDFNLLGSNPGALAVIIENKKVADQILFNIPKRIPLVTTRDIGGAIGGALTTTIDVKGLREYGHVLTIDSEDVTSLQFSVETEKIFNLIDRATNDIEEYLANHFDEAYSVEVYQDVADWLQHESLEQLDVIIHHYRKLHQLFLTRLRNDDLFLLNADFEMIENNHLMVTVTQLEINIKILEDYYQFKRHQRDNVPTMLPNLDLYHHINLTPERSGNAWWQETKNKLEKEWQLMIKESLYLKREVQKFHDIMTKEIPHRLSCRKQWEVGLKKLIGLQEELKIVAKKKHKIEVQLTGKANEDKQSSQLYGKLMLLLQELEVKRALPLLWDKILSHITLHDPNIVFHSKNIKDNLYFHFDLHDPVDLKIFLLALGDFFRWQDQCARQQNLFFGKNIYQEDCKAWWMLMKHLFPGFVRPHDFKSLSNFIQQDGVDLYASHYRLQEMKEHLLRSFGSIKVSAPLHQSATSMDLSNVFKHSMNYAATSRFFKRHAIWQRRVAPLKNELTDYTVASPLSMPVVKEGDRTSLFFGKE